MRLRMFTLLALLALLVVDVRIVPPAAASSTLDSTFFSDDFEAGVLGANWSSSTTYNGVAELTSNYAYGGTQSVFLGQKVAGAASTNLDLSVDLTGQSDVFLDFWARATGDYTQENSSVSISTDGGATWNQILDLSSVSLGFTHQVFDIGTLVAAKGLVLNNQFRVRFYYVSGCCGYGHASNGLVIDDLRLTQRAAELASFPLDTETFEAGAFQQGFFPQGAYNGVAEINSTYAHGGTQSVFLGQKLAGAASANLDLAVDLTGQSDVILDFWARATGDYVQENSSVSISTDGGATWIQILDLSGVSLSFSHQVLDIGTLAAAKGLVLNNQFRVRFYYVSGCCGYGHASNGLVLDDLKFTQSTTELASFPFGTETLETGTLQQGLYAQSSYNGVAEISSKYAHSGAKSLFLGQKVAGAASASLILAFDLTGQTDALLDFWARMAGNYSQENSTLSISDDGGTNWTQILDLGGAPQSFVHQSLNIASLATSKGLALNNQFRVRFYYVSGCCGYGVANNGLVLDDLKLVRTSVSGKVYNEAATTGSEVAGAYVEICSASNVCQTIASNSDGSYGFGDLAAGSYTLRALPPANNTHLIGNLGPVTLAANGTLANQNILLPKATGLPSGAAVTPVVGNSSGVPSIFWKTATTISQKGCTGGTASYRVTSGGAVVRSGSMSESPAGTYSAQVAPFFPIHGSVQVEINITCTNGPQPAITFNIWIDPSGLVVDTNGKPIAGATVSLYRSEATSLADATATSFSTVPTGSAIMSPANRTNPMTSDASGAFGWDVVAGYYKVRAEKAGCTMPGGSQAYNETNVLAIPPAVSDLRLVLYCGEQTMYSVYLPLIRR